MRFVDVKILSAFVDNDKGGNPAGVVLDADELTAEDKLSIAQRVGLSETAFVSKSNIADFKLDFFTPKRQIAHCGHATIATFSYLSQQGMIRTEHTSKETIEGRREILIKGDLAFMEQSAPSYLHIPEKSALLSLSLGLKEVDLLQDIPLSVVNTGNAFCLIAVTGIDAMERIRPDFELITQVSDEYDLVGYYVFCRDTGDACRDANTRMFGPRYGIMEESGTGMAAGPLACYLYDLGGLRKDRFHIQQGWFMNPPSPSLILVDLELENGKIRKLMAGGKGVPVRSLRVEI